MPNLAMNSTRLRAKICKQCYEEFVKEFWSEVPGTGPLIWNWHMSLICDYLQEMAFRVWKGLVKEFDLVFNVPFGTSKSTLISILFPDWVWSFFPEARFITSSHTDSLVLDLSYKSRWVLRSDKYREYFPHVGFRSDKDTKSDYANTSGGERMSCTVGGKTPTGRHAHFVLIDDPIDPQGARSEVELETASKFMTEVIPSRVVDKMVSVTVLVMQRLHYRDPTAVILETGRKEGATPVKHICLPGELTEDLNPPLEELRYKYQEAYQDGVMDPKRLPMPVLKKFQATLGAYGYAGQILQKPHPPGGGMFKVNWFNNRVKAAPYHAKRIRAWDKASTQDGGCATAGVLIAKDNNGNYYVEHVVRGQWETNEREDRILAAALRDRARYGPKNEPVIYVEHEPGSGGVDSFRGTVRKLAGFVVKPDRPTGSKDARAEPWASQLAAGNVFLVDDGSWDLAGYIQEHELFRPEPGKRLGHYKDQVDASSSAFNLLAGVREAGTVRVLPLRSQGKEKGLRIVVCSQEELSTLMIEPRCLLVKIEDPLIVEEVMCNESVVSATRSIAEQALVRTVSGDRSLPASEGGDVNVAGGNGDGGELRTGTPLNVPFETSPGHSFFQCLDSLTVRFADLDPADCQEKWEEPISPWNLPAHQLCFNKGLGKKLWAFILKKRDPAPEVVVFQDSGDQRAKSIAYALSDTLRLPRSVIHLVSNSDVKQEGKAPNAFIYDLFKLTRETVL